MDGLVMEGMDAMQELAGEDLAPPPFPGSAIAATGGEMRVIAVTSGKGGVGKSNVVANLAVSLAKRGKRVIILDADLGLANLDTLLGLFPKFTLRNVLSGEVGLEEILLEGPHGIQLIPAASGHDEMTNLTQEQKLLLLDQVSRLEGRFDVLLLDTGAGISSTVLFFVAAAIETLVVVTPEPTSITDAYALIKVLRSRYAEREFRVVVNMARSELEARRTFSHLARVAERFLHVSLRTEGYIPFDEEVPESVRRQQPVLDLAPSSPGSLAFGRLAERLLGGPPEGAAKGGLQFFFHRLLHVGQA
jgi:flagellar biosynthesis protein FlhG